MWLYQIRREAPCSDGALLGKNSLGIVQILQIVQSHASWEKQGSELGKVELMKVPTMTGGGAIHMSKKFLNNACPWKRFWRVIGARITDLAIYSFSEYWMYQTNLIKRNDVWDKYYLLVTYIFIFIYFTNVNFSPSLSKGVAIQTISDAIDFEPWHPLPTYKCILWGGVGEQRIVFLVLD